MENEVLYKKTGNVIEMSAEFLADHAKVVGMIDERLIITYRGKRYVERKTTKEGWIKFEELEKI